jgi:hypothetical protein
MAIVRGRRVSAIEVLKRVGMLLAHLGAPAPERAHVQAKPQLHTSFHHHSDRRPVPIVGIGCVCPKDSYPEILAESRRVTRDCRHSRPVSPFSSRSQQFSTCLDHSQSRLAISCASLPRGDRCSRLMRALVKSDVRRGTGRSCCQAIRIPGSRTQE